MVFFSEAEANLIRLVFGQYLNEANKKLDQLCVNSDQHKNIRLNCDENNACELNLFNEKQRQKQLREAIDLEGQAYQSSCPHHH
ncbi:unnamed protein product [Adineta steineri]|uniref:Uncharacterized protein n=1 Tax=Adineta steineri TaxID=433720 RepID=A0A814DC16_9BILA|nr:unnamed protein product [Adineta steineri]